MDQEQQDTQENEAPEGYIEHKGSLEKAQDILYRRESVGRLPNVRSHLSRIARAYVPRGFKPKDDYMKRGFWSSPLNLALVAASVFFFGSLIFLVYSLATDRTVISGENVDVTIKGPLSIAAGEELQLQILVQNNNPVAIEAVDLVVDYPLGARRADATRTPIARADRDFIGTLAPGQAVNRTLHIVLFGEQDEEQQFTFGVEFRPAGSNAVIESNRNYAIPLTAAPVSLAVSLPQQVSASQEFEGTISVRSNASTVLEDVRVTIKYPPGFEFLDATPQPSTGRNVFDIGDLFPGSEKTITISGDLLGQDSELKTFTITVGEEGESGTISVPYNSSLHTLTIVRPSLEGVLVINDLVRDPAILPVNERVRGHLEITNNHNARVIDLEAQMRFVGDVINPTSVEVGKGFFKSLDQTIEWSRGDSFSGVLEPGETVELPFAFSLISSTQRSNLIDSRSLKLDITMAGRLVNPDQNHADLEVFLTRELRVNSDIKSTARLVYFTGPFQNTGDVPPRVNQLTTYTAIWAITNGTNDLRDVTLSATLPPNVAYTGQVSPGNEEVIYNPEIRKVTWRGGIVRSGTGTTRPVREVAFQVSLLPSAPQVNQVLTIVNETQVTATDTFTNARLEGTTNALTTVLVTDPRYVDDMGAVSP